MPSPRELPLGNHLVRQEMHKAGETEVPAGKRATLRRHPHEQLCLDSLLPHSRTFFSANVTPLLLRHAGHPAAMYPTPTSMSLGEELQQ